MSLDRAALHQLLWMDAHPRRRSLQVNHAALAVELRVSRGTVSRAIATMVLEGRVTKIGHDIRNATYRIHDPARWEESPDGDHEPDDRRGEHVVEPDDGQGDRTVEDRDGG